MIKLPFFFASSMLNGETETGVLSELVVEPEASPELPDVGFSGEIVGAHDLNSSNRSVMAQIEMHRFDIILLLSICISPP
jgi:hypothetical protein